MKGVIIPGPFSNIDIFRIKDQFSWLAFFFLREFSRKKYDLVVFYRDKELIAGGFACLLYRRPYVYFSLEIRGYDEIKTVADRVRKQLEIIFNRLSILTVVQDETRKALILRVHGLESDKIHIVPNAFMRVSNKKQDLIRARHGIPVDKVVILYPGALQAWALSEDLLEAAASWDEKFVLVLHGFAVDGFVETLKKKAAEVNARAPGRIYISTDVLAEKEYLDYVASADIGLPWYQCHLVNNVKTIGKSSGKFSAFMSCGVPVVVPAYLEALKGFVETYHCGIAVDGEPQIGAALDKVIDKLDEYKKNARSFYDQELNFEKSFKEFLQKVKNRIEIPV